MDVLFYMVIAVAAALAAVTFITRARWATWALLGMLPGAVIGAVFVLAIALFDAGREATGWEGLIAIVAAMFGGLIGALAGALIGGVLGLTRTNRTAASRGRG